MESVVCLGTGGEKWQGKAQICGDDVEWEFAGASLEADFPGKYQAGCTPR